MSNLSTHGVELPYQGPVQPRSQKPMKQRILRIEYPTLDDTRTDGLKLEDNLPVSHCVATAHQRGADVVLNALHADVNLYATSILGVREDLSAFDYRPLRQSVVEGQRDLERIFGSHSRVASADQSYDGLARQEMRYDRLMEELSTIEAAVKADRPYFLVSSELRAQNDPAFNVVLLQKKKKSIQATLPVVEPSDIPQLDTSLVPTLNTRHLNKEADPRDPAFVWA